MRRLITTLTVLVAFGAAPVAGATDLRSPDARDSGRQLARATATDLRSPDARDSGRQVAGTTVTDLRSPDARDVAVRPVSTYEQGPIVAPPVRPIVRITDGGFSWGDAGIGAAGTLGLIALLAGTGLVVSQRRRDRRVPVATN